MALSTSLSRTDLTGLRATATSAFREPGMVLATVAKATFLLHESRSAIGALGNFQLVSFDAHRDCALNTGDGDDKMFAIVVVENSDNPIENAAANAHPLAAVQKRPDGAGRLRS